MLLNNKKNETVFLTVIFTLMISEFGSAQDEIIDLKFGGSFA
jgi:hypothetical protein